MIFGNQAPKFQVLGTDVLLDYAVIEVDRPDEKTLKHESALNRARVFISKPQHHIFTVVIHLHRYADPEAKYAEIVAHLDSQLVKVWRHRDGIAFRDENNLDADFVFLKYDPFYIQTVSYPDGLRLFFESVSVIDHSQSGDNWTFARALTGGSSNAWYLDPTTGFLVVAPDTTTSRRLTAGRFNGTAILLEGVRENLIDAPSGPFDSGNWGAFSITPAANTLETLDPTGVSNNADRLLATGAGGAIIHTTGTAVGNNVALSGWVKCQVGTVPGTLTVNGTTGGSDTTGVFTATPEWTKFSHIVDTSAFTGLLRCNITITNNTDVIYLWGVQFEDNAEFPSTIVDPVATAAATRALEKFTILSADTKLTKLKGTVLIWVKPKLDPTSLPNGFFTIFQSGDSGGATSDLHVDLQFDGFSGDRLVMRVRANNDGTTGIQWVPLVATGITQNNWHQVVFTWDATISNGGHIYVDGVELSTGSTNSAFNVSETGDTISIGSELDSATPAYGEYDELFIDDRVWSSEEVLEKFNSGSLKRSLI